MQSDISFNSHAIPRTGADQTATIPQPRRRLVPTISSRSRFLSGVHGVKHCGDLKSLIAWAEGPAPIGRAVSTGQALPAANARHR